MSIKVPFWATTLTILGVIVLCSLGKWQIDRLQWKQGLLQEIEAQYTRDADQNRLTINSNPIQRGVVNGHFIADKEFKIGPRTYDGKPGYHVITPLRIKDGSHLLVNRGWIPLDLEKEAYEISNRSYHVVGLLRNPDTQNPFTPENNIDEDIWYWIDFDAITKSKNIQNLWPAMLYAEENKKDFPIAAATKPQLRNDHLQYAFFWFSMAGILIVIYGLRFLRKKS